VQRPEEPRERPGRLRVRSHTLRSRAAPAVVVAAASTEGRSAARAAAARILAGLPALHAAPWNHYRELLASTLEIETPDARLNRAFTWAKVGIDKGLATNRRLARGCWLDSRTSGDSERPGFAWFFGGTRCGHARDPRPTALRDDRGDALRFLAASSAQMARFARDLTERRFVPCHRLSVRVGGADATRSFVIAQADYWRASGDRPFLDASWPAIVRAYDFSRRHRF